MNSNAYIVSGIIAFVFLVAKFVEMRFSKTDEEDEAPSQSKPLKFLMRDAFLVYVSSLIGFYVISQFEDHSVNSAVKEVAAFTGGPDF
jgi:heme/copper-type cytochrome/quinol oxidase subunit 3